VVEDRPIMSVKYCLPVPVFYFWRKLQCPLQCGLSAIAEHLVIIISDIRRGYTENDCINDRHCQSTATYISTKTVSPCSVVSLRELSYLCKLL